MCDGVLFLSMYYRGFTVAGFELSRRGTRILIYQGFRFCFVRQQRSGRCKWVCSQKSKTNLCRATAITELDRVVGINNTHSHPKFVNRKREQKKKLTPTKPTSSPKKSTSPQNVKNILQHLSNLTNTTITKKTSPTTKRKSDPTPIKTEITTATSEEDDIKNITTNGVKKNEKSKKSDTSSRKSDSSVKMHRSNSFGSRKSQKVSKASKWKKCEILQRSLVRANSTSNDTIIKVEKPLKPTNPSPRDAIRKKKAPKERAHKASDYCGDCGGYYYDSKGCRDWIQCTECKAWYHEDCDERNIVRYGVCTECDDGASRDSSSETNN